jgi:hypothetical protein
LGAKWRITLWNASSPEVCWEGERFFISTTSNGPFTIFSSSLYALEPEIISKLLLYHNHSKAVEMAFN